MGLLIKLENGDTSLKSLKFGKDRIGGGDSGQPYIQTPIDGESGISTSGNTDFLLRGGVQAPSRAVDDVARLTKYMFSTKSPSGLLFIAKQNLLSRVSPKTEASKGIGYAGGSLNAGVYTPLSTLAQAGVGYLGIHLNKQGLDPTGLIPGLGINKYEDVVKKNNEPGKNNFPKEKITTTLIQDPLPVTSKTGTTPSLSISEQTSIVGGFTNRLLNIWYNKQFKFSYSNNVDVYGGGPGSVLGIGKTKIRFTDQRTGNQNIDLRKSKFFDTLESSGYYDYGAFKSVRPLLYRGASIFNGKTVSSRYEDITGDNLLEDYSTINESDELQKFLISSTNAGTGSLYVESEESKKLRKDPKEGSRTFNTETLLKGITTNSAYTSIGKLDTGLNTGPKVKDILNFPTSPTEPGSLYVTSSLNVDSSKFINNRDIFKEETGAPNNQPTYLTSLNNKYPNPDSDLNGDFAIETRLALGDPGRVKGTYAKHITKKDQVLDKINASPIYTRTSNSTGFNSKDYNDIVSFRIGIIDPTTPNKTHYMNFRAYIDSFSDSYNASWKGQKYMGRAEEFYKYDGFGRDISLAFTVVAHSQGEMHGMYQKLNFLASSLAPTYTTAGYMAGNLAKLTLGDYIHEQPGFISSITYDIPQESSWELSLTPEGQIANKNNPDELPFMIKVTGFKFTPIHTFRPEIQTDKDKTDKDELTSPNRFITNDLKFNPSWHKGDDGFKN